jgi:uncharacterized protein with PIN domain
MAAWRASSDAEIAMINAPQFVTDAMLGKLTKWLRVIGMDVMYDPDTTDAQLLQCAERGGRIFLTRDRRLTQRRSPVQLLYVESDYYHEQVRQVVQAFHLADRIQVFTRCLRCNALLRAIAKEVVAERVPPYVYATQMTFKRCETCNRLYWGGTHRDNMLRQLQTMLSGLLTISPGTFH